MQQFDKFLGNMKDDGFKFSVSETEWGRRYTGTKERGAFRKPEKVLILHFERQNPSPVQFGNFIRDAEKLCEKNGLEYVVEGIYLVTPSDIDRRKQEFRIFLEKEKKEVTRLLRYKGLGSQEPPVESPSLVMKPPVPAVQKSLPRPSDIDPQLRSRSPKEETLFVIDTRLEKAGTRTPVLLAITQERGTVFRQVSEQLVAHGIEFKWEQVAHIDTEERPTGELVLVINDGKRVHEFAHPQAEDLRRLISHLKWAREGYLTGFIEEHDFDPDLISKSKKDMLDGRYTDAVRNAFALLESRIRHDSLAPVTLHGKDLLDYAFSATSGRLNFGRIEPEKNGLYMLFAGTFAWLRNPASHTSELRNFGKEDAFEVLALINHLLKLSQMGNEAARSRPA